MAWLYLFFAGLFEVGWPVGMKFSQSGNHRIASLLFAIVCIVVSGWLLWLAQKTIPMGTAYAVWTGIGTMGTFLFGILFFGDAHSLLRWLGMLLILSGIVLLKLGENAKT